MGSTRQRGLAGTLLVAGTLLLATVTVGSLVEPTQAQSGSTTFPGCEALYDVPATSAGDTELKALAFSFPSDGWAVGTSSGPSQVTLFAAHWNGHIWSQVPMPNPGIAIRKLGAVAALSPDDAWAAGSYAANDGTDHTLTMHWDGSQWKQVEVAGAGGGGEITGLAAVSSNDVWAVGHYYGALYKYQQPMMLHWDGVKWTTTNIPSILGSPSVLAAVSARAADDVWAVGRADGMPSSALHLLHWNGTTWSDTPVTDAGPSANIEAIKAIGANDVWATGGDFNGPLILHWDGHAWSRVATPATGAFQTTVSSIAAFSPDDVWAAGTSNVVQSVQDGENKQLLVMHWDGRAWSKVPASNPGVGAVARAVVASGDGRLWMAGSYASARSGTRTGFLEYISDIPCSPTTPGTTPADTRSVLLSPPAPLPGSGAHTFPETGKTVTGIFLDYWQQHGGLMQQGYPISDVVGEVSEVDGKLYTVQYFERAVFEYHPENRPPYNVLLSQLGRFQYSHKYPGGRGSAPRPGEQPNNSPGSVLFPQTGKRLGGTFQAYWNGHGGLAQQGYPISDEFVEKSDVDGKPYLVQYFERAVFEYHPENPPPYDVLLAQLGRFRYDTKYGDSGRSSPAPGPNPGPAATAAAGASGPRLVLEMQGRPSVAGHFILWLSGHENVVAVNGYDLEQNRQFVLAENPTNKDQPVSDGKIAVWLQDCPPYCQRIRGYDLGSNNEFHIIEPAPGRSFFKLFLDNGQLYYEKYLGTDLELYAYDMAAGGEKLIDKSLYGNDIMFRGKIGGGMLVWTQVNDTGREWSLYYTRLDGTQTNVLVDREAQPFTGYNASGDNIVWSTLPTPPDEYNPSPSDPRAFVYNTRTGQKKALSTQAAYAPVINGNVVAWSTLSLPGGPTGPVEAYDLATGTGWTVTRESGTSTWIEGIVGEQKLVYSAQNPIRGDRDIFVADLTPTK